MINPRAAGASFASGSATPERWATRGLDSRGGGAVIDSLLHFGAASLLMLGALRGLQQVAGRRNEGKVEC